jgi:hypothetical protein
MVMVLFAMLGLVHAALFVLNQCIILLLVGAVALVNISLATLSSWLDPVKVNRAIEKAVSVDQGVI